MENKEAIAKINSGKSATLITDSAEGTPLQVAEGQETANYDNLWISKEFFIWFVIGLLTLVFGWVMLFRREQLAKDAKYGAVGYFVVVISILLFTYFSSPGKL